MIRQCRIAAYAAIRTSSSPLVSNLSMGCLWQDLRFGLRVLRRNPGFTAVAVAAIALGIGATSAMFSVIYGVLLKPLPYRDPARLVRVYESNAGAGFPMFPMSPANFVDYRAQNRVFEDFATYVRQDQQFGGEHPERLTGVRVSHGFFHMLGVEPVLGRSFTKEEEANSGPDTSVIISYNVWQRLCGGDPHMLGKMIRLSDFPFTVVGVMPRRFEHAGGGYRLPYGQDVDVWLPFNLLGNPQRLSRSFHYCNTIARLKPGVTAEAAQTGMNVVARRLEGQYPDDRGWSIRLTPLHDEITGKSRPMLLVLAGAVALVLLIACVNVANLLLARATVREREIAIRSALGAGRLRLARQMLTESLALAALGGALGLLLAFLGVRALVALGPAQLPRLHAISVDGRMFLVTAAASLLSALLFGMPPARAISSGLRRTRPLGAFVVAEVALAFVLLIGAGLLLRTFAALQRVAPGFNPRGVLTMSTSLSVPKLVGARRYAAFYERFIEKLAQLPGVSAAGASSNLPWTGANDNANFGIEGRPRAPNVNMHAHYQFVTPDYLRTIGVPLVAGRWLTAADHFDAPKVVLVSKTLALEYWRTAAACLGQRIYTFRDATTIGQGMTIVGVVGDVKDSPTDALPQPAFYEPFLQSPSFGNLVALRSGSDPATLIPAVRRVAAEMGNDLSIQDIRPMEQVVAAAISSQRFALQMIGIFAAVALALALIGIYGVTSYAASRRAREIAIRLALGARRSDTLRLLLAQGLRLVAAGILAGGLAGLVLTRVLSSLLYGVSSTDPMTFAAAGAILAGVGTAACFAPARRALGIDPMEVLRHE
jgi:predicted permease